MNAHGPCADRSPNVNVTGAAGLKVAAGVEERFAILKQGDEKRYNSWFAFWFRPHSRVEGAKGRDRTKGGGEGKRGGISPQKAHTRACTEAEGPRTSKWLVREGGTPEKRKGQIK